jgi:hypothetical protein
MSPNLRPASRLWLEKFSKFIDTEPQAVQNCAQRARRDVLALVDRHDRGARGIIEVSDHHVATSSMNFDKTNASQRSKGPGATYLGQLLTPPWTQFAAFRN